jgi:lysozyme
MRRRWRIAGAICLAGRVGFLRPIGPTTADFRAVGVDVSHHQGEIDWRMAATDVAFARIEANEGDDYRTSESRENHARRRGGRDRGG